MQTLLFTDHTIDQSLAYRALKGGDHLVRLAEDKQHLYDLTNTPDPYELIILEQRDRRLTDCVSKLRSSEVLTPIMVVAGTYTAPFDAAECLDAGADGYLKEPEPSVLIAYLQALRRRSNGNVGRLVEVGDVRIDLRRQMVFKCGARVRLTRQEYRILEVLAGRQGAIVSIRDLYRLSHDQEDDIDSENVTRVFVSHLRRQLGRSLVETVRGLGYRIPKMQTAPS